MSATVRAALGVLALAAAAACTPPQPTLDLQLSEGPAQACPSASCTDIKMSCQMYLSVRILDPDDRTAPFSSQCLEIPRRTAPNDDLCTVNGIELSAQDLPYRDLEVQVAIYPEDVVHIDETSMLPVCPSGTLYDSVDGFPIASDITPALGGRGYYRAGDDTIHITLGCTDLDMLASDECEGVANTTVQATVDDFDTHVSVGQNDATKLIVSAGEPRTSGAEYTLSPDDVTPLDRISGSIPPAWARDVPRLFTSSLCLTVLDDTPQSTTAVTCRRDGVSITTDSYALTGVRLTKTSLDQILAALSLAAFPTEGLTIGVVVDGGIPVANQVVTASAGTIQYLNAARTGVGGTMTSGGTTGAVFVSRDAPYGTTFETTRAIPAARATAFGGRIAGKVTIVILDLSTGAST